MNKLISKMAALQQLLDCNAFNVSRYELTGAGDVHLVFTDGSGREGSATVTLLDVALPAERRATPRPKQTYVRYESQAYWMAEELRARDLPIYWNRDELVALLGPHRDQAAGVLTVSAELGVASGEIERFRSLHRIDNARKEWLQLQWDTGDYATQQDFARQMGESTSTISKIVGKPVENSKATWRADHEEAVKAMIRDRISTPAILLELRALGVTQSVDKVNYYVKRLRDQVSDEG